LVHDGDWGWNIEETARKLPEVSERARQRVQQLRDEGYPLITAQNAAAEVEETIKSEAGAGVGYPITPIYVRFLSRNNVLSVWHIRTN
jgi:hypothetical protein